MSLQTDGPFKVVAAIAAGIFLLSIIVLIGYGDYGIVSGVFLALLISLLSGIVLYLGFGGKLEGPPSVQTAAKPAAAAEAEPAPTPAPAAKPEPAPEPEPETEPEPVAAPVASTEAERPTGIDGPRAGQADDLKRIKGVGPKLEKLCNSLGFWHFDQIAAWTIEEVAWVDDNLEGFKGRVTRDKWVEQARALAAEK